MKGELIEEFPVDGVLIKSSLPELVTLEKKTLGQTLDK